MMTTLTARPEAITFDPQQSALIVVDMQNAYATPGGYLDLAQPLARSLPTFKPP